MARFSSEQCQAGASEIRNATTNNVIEIINSVSECKIPGCRLNSTSWNRVAFLNMSDPFQKCPNEWSDDVIVRYADLKGCGRRPVIDAGCDSVVYSTRELRYRSVCGYIKGYQYGNPNAFNSSISGNIGLENWYIDGVSLTHGPPGARKHIWSFVNVWYDVMTQYLNYSCPCTFENDSVWPYSVPEFVGNNYFCDAGYRHESYVPGLSNDTLWDGAGCGRKSTCCQFNNPPWFCRSLPEATTDDLEVRICSDQATSNENTYIHQMELYVK